MARQNVQVKKLAVGFADALLEKFALLQFSPADCRSFLDASWELWLRNSSKKRFLEKLHQFLYELEEQRKPTFQIGRYISKQLKKYSDQLTRAIPNGLMRRVTSLFLGISPETRKTASDRSRSSPLAVRTISCGPGRAARQGTCRLDQETSSVCGCGSNVARDLTRITSGGTRRAPLVDRLRQPRYSAPSGHQLEYKNYRTICYRLTFPPRGRGTVRWHPSWKWRPTNTQRLRSFPPSDSGRNEAPYTERQSSCPKTEKTTPIRALATTSTRRTARTPSRPRKSRRTARMPKTPRDHRPRLVRRSPPETATSTGFLPRTSS